VRKVLRFFLWTMIVVVVLAGALFSYFVYAPYPAVPRLSGRLSEGVIEIGGLRRSYLYYVPRLLGGGAACRSDARFG
jgi:polyhydroxybutyrate depolymerase